MWLVILFGFTLVEYAWSDPQATCLRTSNWGPWRCPGDDGQCTSSIASRYKCPEGDCVSGSQCTSMPGFSVSKCLSSIASLYLES